MSSRTSIRRSIGFKLLRYVFGYYCVVTLLLTVAHLANEYDREKKNLFHEFELHERSLIKSLTNSVWHLDLVQLNDTLTGVIEFPYVTGASVHTTQGELLGHIGIVASSEARMPVFELNLPTLTKENNITFADNLFEHRFELVQEEYGKSELIGTVVLYSNSDTLYNRLYPQFSSIILAALIKTIVLWGLFIYFGQRFLSIPLQRLVTRLTQLPLDHSGEPLKTNGAENELDLLDASFQRMTQHLNDTLGKLNQESNRKSQFLANMSHEIRTPLNAVTGMTYLLSQTPLNRQQQRYIETVNHSMTHVTGLIDDLLDVAKIESGKLTLESTLFDLDTVFISLSSSVTPMSLRDEIELHYDIPVEIPRKLIGDPLRLGQVLINLTSNAIKFSKSGDVVVAVKLESLTPNDVRLKFSVHDQGIGMTRKQASLVFDLFQQADASTTRRYGGTGLGLTISKHLVESMGGTIWVESTLGEGSCFSFTSPFKLNPDEPWGRFEIPEILRGCRFLVADDSPQSTRILSDALESFNLDVKVVSSAPEALNELLRASSSTSDKPYDLAIVDSQLNGLDRIDRAITVNQQSELSQLSTLLLGNSLASEAIPSRLVGLANFGTYLNKPYTIVQLFDTIAEILSHETVKPRPIGARTTTNARTTRGHILLVEDQDTNRQIAAEILALHHFTVEMAENGREAVDRVMMDSGRFDLILMDLQMPVMDGYEASRKIREFAPDGLLPIIAMTAHALPDELSRCQAAGMNAHITKPINVNVLLAELDKWMAPAAAESGKQKPLKSQLTISTDYPASIAGVDLANALERIGGNQELYFRLLRQFIERYEVVLREIHSALEIGDSESAISLCHQFTGVAANLSAVELSAASRDLENALKEKRMGSNHLMGIMQRHFEIIRQSLTEFDEQEQSPSDA